jgi:hypothetical protein
MSVQAELSHSGTSVRAVARIVSRLSAIVHTSDRFTTKTGYLTVDGIKPSVKDRYRTRRNGTPDPEESTAVLISKP